MHTFWTTGPQDTITSVISTAAAEKPDNVFLDFVGETYTFRQIDEKSTSLAAGLQSIGVRPGQTVTTLLDNNVDAIISWFAINKAGAISVPLNTALKGEFLRHQITDSGAEVIIAESDYAERIATIAEELNGLKTLVTRGNTAVAADGMAPLTLDAIRLPAGDFVVHPNKPSDNRLAPLKHP